MFGPDGPSLVELARQALSSTVKGYDLLAPKFEHTPFRTPDAVLGQVGAYLGAHGSVSRGLDLCCGTGAGMGMLRGIVTDEVVGLDFSSGMLAEAERRLRATPGGPTLRFVQGNALELDYHEVFDVVTSFGAFGHFQPYQQPALIRGVYEALVPGGRFGFVTSTMPTPRERLWWVYRGFNGVMRVRNRIVKPEFVMYYLHFTVPQILPMFEAEGFDVVLYDADWDRRPYKIAIATKPS